MTRYEANMTWSGCLIAILVICFAILAIGSCVHLATNDMRW